MTSFALPPTAQPGDRLPDVWLRFGDGERVRLHKVFGGRAMVLAVGIEAEALRGLAVAPAADALAVNVRGEVPDGWRLAAADSDWCALFATTIFDVDANLRVIGPHAGGGHAARQDEHPATPNAPVLQLPRVLEPELCVALIEHFERDCEGGDSSHVLVIENGVRTPHLAPDIKARRESPIRDPALEAAVQARLLRRVVPEIARVFQFQVARRDPFKLLAYAEGAGYFHAHRDNDTPDVAYRRFAISVNLDAGAYSGGEFRFPEFGPAPYSPATGAALVFSCSLLHEVTPITQGTRHALTTFVA
ncbi:2OG-Fe(II) oxygenase [Lysobacter claricitrinus]|uniref:2OG-Fe(II) oxygenase n=1 Tax=Lysobacter claricitrinus TaxID=3367728 RepID=UPI0037DB857F